MKKIKLDLDEFVEIKKLWKLRGEIWMNSKLNEFQVALQKNLKFAEIGMDATAYIRLALLLSAALFGFSWLAISLLIENILLAFGIGIFAFSFVIIGAYLYPIFKKEEIAGKVEKELPNALIAMSIDLNLNTQYEKALKNIADGNFGLFSEKVNDVLKEVKNTNSSTQEALTRMGNSVDSIALRRAINQMVNSYKNASKRDGGYALRQLALDQMQIQRTMLKEFAGKVAVYSLLFIGGSVILPGLFLPIASLASLIMPLDLTPNNALLITTVAFPLMNFIIFRVVISKMPLFMR